MTRWQFEKMTVAGVLALTACATTDNKASVVPLKVDRVPAVVSAAGVRTLPKAVVYKTNRPVADHVAVRVSHDGKTLIYFPAPSDVGADSAPLELSDGWLLDRQGGISTDTRFLRYTYAEYSRLKQTPSPGQLLDSIIPEVRVVSVRVLNDLTQQAAAADTAAVNALLHNPSTTTVTAVTPELHIQTP